MAETSATEYPAMLVRKQPCLVLTRRAGATSFGADSLELAWPRVPGAPPARMDDVSLIATGLRHTSNQRKQSTPSMTA